MKKKVLSMLLTCFMVMTMAACGGAGKPAQADQPQSNTNTAVTSTDGKSADEALAIELVVGKFAET